MHLDKATRRFRRGWIPLAFCFLFSSCGPQIRQPSPKLPMTLTIPNLYPNCHNPLSSTAPLAFTGTVVVYSIDNSGNNPVEVDRKDFASGSNSSLPVTVTINAPSQGYHTLKVFEKGACSTCTPMVLPGWQCYQVITSTGIQAAKPIKEWSYTLLTYTPSRTLGQSGWAYYADQASCGCLVPN